MSALVLMIVLPLATAFLLPVLNRLSAQAGRFVGPLVLAITTTMGFQALWSAADSVTVIELGGFAPPLGIVLYADAMAVLFATAISLGTLLLWPSERGNDPVRGATMALLLAGAGCGLALSGDLFNIYVFYELTAVASFGLAVGRNSPASYAATLRFGLINGAGAALALCGIALIYQATGSLNLAHLAELGAARLDNPQGLAAFALLLIGFGVKAELFPVNTWVPELYATAPARVAAILAGIVSKLALVIIVRLLVLVFHQPQALTLLLLLGLLTIVTGELAAWRSRDLKRMLAFSSIGQLGIIFVAFAVPGAAGLFAGLTVALHHLLVKPALFLLSERWGGACDGLAGAAKQSPLGAALFVLLAMSLIGVPPLPGFWAKLAVLMELGHQTQPLYLFAGLAILAGAALETSYLFRVVGRLYHPPTDLPAPAAHGFIDLSTAALLALALLSGLYYLPEIAVHIHAIADQAADGALYVRSVRPGLM